ncbi:unnamed protein product, partial [Adineta steineri]
IKFNIMDLFNFGHDQLEDGSFVNHFRYQTNQDAEQVKQDSDFSLVYRQWT